MPVRPPLLRPPLPDRRDFLRMAASAGLVIGSTTFFGGCEKIAEKIRNRPIRRSLATLAANDPIVLTYRDAVAAMKALPGTDPRSWESQALIHQNWCPHQNWFFLPWHRAYLSYLEQICRELTGNEEFALPYWDWTADAHVPAPFWDTSSALFHPGRSATSSSTANAGLIGRPIIDDILDETDFELFASYAATGQRDRTTYGRLEQTPHNYIHGFVGGDMSTFMSPRDPIFWTHHNMIECLWVDWNVGRGNPNSSDPAWTGFQFTGNFVDRNGVSVNITVGLTALFPLLQYRFDGACGGPDGIVRMDRALSDTTALREFLRRGGPPRKRALGRFDAPSGVELRAGGAAAVRIPVPRDAVGSALAGRTERLVLRLEEVRPPADNSVFVRAFVNKPDATAATPIDDPSYAGSFAFFHDPAHGEGIGSFLVDLSPALRRLSTAGRIRPGAPVEVQLVTVPIEGRQLAPVTIDVRRIGIERIEMTEAAR